MVDTKPEEQKQEASSSSGAAAAPAPTVEDEYACVARGRLKLKSGGDSSESKRKKRKRRHGDDDERTSNDERRASEQGGGRPGEVKIRKTPAELAFLKMQEKMQKERIAQKASMTHKQRVEKFNQHLDSLTEHFDIPKVSWTK